MIENHRISFKNRPRPVFNKLVAEIGYGSPSGGGALKLSLGDSPKLDSQGGGKGPELSLFMQVYGCTVSDGCLAPIPHEESPPEA